MPGDLRETLDQVWRQLKLMVPCAAMRRRGRGIAALVELGEAGKRDAEGLDRRLGNGRRRRDDGARIYPTAEKRPDRHIGHHMR